MKYRFSIIIVHRNGADMLLKTLSALHLAWNAQQDEILLVDNGSTDDSLVRVKQDYPHVRTIENPCNNGFARACNQGIGQAQGEFIVLLNNDAFMEADTLTRFAEDFRNLPRLGALGGQLLDDQNQLQRSAGEIPTVLDELSLSFFKKKNVYPQHGDLIEVEAVVGACMGVRATAIRDAGSLDNDFFFYFEETEWCYRLRQHGWQVMLDPRARIIHLKGINTRGLRRNAQVEMLRSRLLFYRKTMPALTAQLLTIHRTLQILINTIGHGLITLLTLGLVTKLRDKVGVYLTLLAWLAAGKPENWGLPNKCPAIIDAPTTHSETP